MDNNLADTIRATLEAMIPGYAERRRAETEAREAKIMAARLGFDPDDVEDMNDVMDEMDARDTGPR